MSAFRMPSLGADMEAGTLVQWLKQPGDRVARGDIIAVVETQKGAIEVEIFDSGTVDRLLVAPGTKVPVGTPLALIDGGEAEGEPVAAAASAVPAPPAVAAPPPVAVPSAAVAGARPRASPAARRLAAERGVDLARLAGTGPGGAVSIRDVERLAAAPPIPRRLDMAGMRQAVAAAMARSKREIPHYYLSAVVDLAATLSWLEHRNAQQPPSNRLLPGAVYVKAVALGLRKFPDLNGTFTEGGFRRGEGIHVGMAIALRGGGLVAPALHDADKRSLDAVMEDLRDLVQRVRAGTLRSSEMSNPTITVSSLGDRGVDALFGVIYPPQVAIVGFGTPAMRPWVVDGAVVARPVLSISLAGDHRVSDGHYGALFLREIDTLLQQPEAL